MGKTKYTIGVDFGTDSVRALIVNTKNGAEMSESVFYYPRWKDGKYCDPAKNQFRQHPNDYIEGIQSTIIGAVSQCSLDVTSNVVGISIDTTGSTVVAVDKDGTPLSLLPDFRENPNAMFVLWKDHTALVEAEEINELSSSWPGVDYTKYEGGIYSSEWFWAKVLHLLREDKSVADAAFSWVEHCDWIAGLLCGNTNPVELKRSRCAAGHKAMWHAEWEGLPSEEFLAKLDPLLKGLRDRLYSNTYTSDVKAGIISKEWAGKLGLPEDVAIGVGAFDAHLGAVGGEVKPYYMSKVMGTSTCDMMVAPEEAVKGNLISGICGQVDGSITPGLIGLEAGQSAFGDIYAWFKNVLLWPIENVLPKSSIIDDVSKDNLLNDISDRLIAELSTVAEAIPIEESAIVALDWMNGRRTPDANHSLKGAIAGLTLGSDAPRIFKSLVEATAFGSKAIVERFQDEGIRIDGIIAMGGVAKKSTFVMQTVADVLNMPILVAKSDQTSALGSAMAAAVVAGVYSDFEEAQKNMGAGYEKEYLPNPENAETYKKVYQNYKKLGKLIENEFYSG